MTSCAPASAPITSTAASVPTGSTTRRARPRSPSTCSTGAAFDGAAGDTFAFVENIIGTAFADSIVGNGGDNHFKGGGGVDSLDGRAGHNRLDGGDGNDLLHGGEGINAFIGGNGVDTASYSLATSGISVNLLTGNTNGAALDDTFSSIEKIVGTDFADVIQGNNSANSIYGRGGVDVLAGNGGNDVIDAGAGADIVNAGAGDDRCLPGRRRRSRTI